MCWVNTWQNENKVDGLYVPRMCSVSFLQCLESFMFLASLHSLVHMYMVFANITAANISYKEP